MFVPRLDAAMEGRALQSITQIIDANVRYKLTANTAKVYIMRLFMETATNLAYIVHLFKIQISSVNCAIIFVRSL